MNNAPQQPQVSVANRLRQIADWLEAHDVPDEQVFSAGLTVCGLEIGLTSHTLLRASFPGRSAKARKLNSHDELAIESDGILFRAWEPRDDKPAESVEVTL